MNNQIIPFDYNSQQIRVIKDEKGESWWVAKDVCDVLGIVDHKVALRKLDEDEKGEYRIPSLGGSQKTSVINESGLYTLILRSDKPEAKPFRKWITSEVLPTLFKTGTYSIAKPEPVTLIPIAKEFRAAIILAKAAGLQGNQATFAANTAVWRITGYDCLDVLGVKQLINEDQETHLTPTQIAQKLSLKSAQATNKLLEKHGFQIKCIGDVSWQATEKGKPFSVLKDSGKAHKTTGKPIQQLMWKESIVPVLMEEIKEGQIAQTPV